MAFHFSKRKLRPQEPEEVGELNIVPYLDIMMNLIMFMLLSMTGLVAFGVLNVSSPKYADQGQVAQANPEDKDKPKLLLTVLISEKGFFVAGSGGVLPGDTGTPDQAGQPTIGKRPNGDYDYPALTAKMTEIKKAFPEESKAILGADAKIPYEVLVRTMDSVRENPTQLIEGKPMTLFFDVSLTVM
ncbi:MAG: biopolymer transporter ExbD [Deltaproteobacteria bacterium]|nr:biopolymer transporter ExbD [Deltaproteobacteria bacterium]